MAIARQSMTDEQRKSVVLEYLKAIDRGDPISGGGSLLDLFADDAQLYYPKWGLANGKEQIGKLLADVGGTVKAAQHNYADFNWSSLAATRWCARARAAASTRLARGGRACPNGAQDA